MKDVHTLKIPHIFYFKLTSIENKLLSAYILCFVSRTR